MPVRTIHDRAQSLQPGVLVELFEADLTVLGGPTIFFHNYPQSASLFWNGNEYVPYPVRAEGFEYKTGGVLPRPKLFFSNVGATISSLLRQYDDCVSAKITRRRTFYEFLDGQPGADPTQEYPPDIFFVEQKVSETNLEVQFELVAASDFEGAQLPGRQMISTLCMWIYRGPNCGYAGPPVADIFGNPITATTDRGAYNAATTYAIGDYAYVMLGGIRQYYVSLASGNTAALTDGTKWVRDRCQKILDACKLRFGATNPLPFGGFPGTSRLPNIAG